MPKAHISNNMRAFGHPFLLSTLILTNCDNSRIHLMQVCCSLGKPRLKKKVAASSHLFWVWSSCFWHGKNYITCPRSQINRINDVTWQCHALQWDWVGWWWRMVQQLIMSWARSGYWSWSRSRSRSGPGPGPCPSSCYSPGPGPDPVGPGLGPGL